MLFWEFDCRPSTIKDKINCIILFNLTYYIICTIQGVMSVSNCLTINIFSSHTLKYLDSRLLLCVLIQFNICTGRTEYLDAMKFKA